MHILNTRPIKIGYPSGEVKITLWAGTEDEECFSVRGLHTNSPYCIAYGTKYYLTKEEIQIAKQLSLLLD